MAFLFAEEEYERAMKQKQVIKLVAFIDIDKKVGVDKHKYNKIDSS